MPHMRCWNYYAINFVNSAIFVIVIPRSDLMGVIENKIEKKNSVALVPERTIPTERPPPVGEVSANFCG